MKKIPLALICFLIISCVHIDDGQSYSTKPTTEKEVQGCYYTEELGTYYQNRREPYSSLHCDVICINNDSLIVIREFRIGSISLDSTTFNTEFIKYTTADTLELLVQRPNNAGELYDNVNVWVFEIVNGKKTLSDSFTLYTLDGNNLCPNI